MAYSYLGPMGSDCCLCRPRASQVRSAELFVLAAQHSDRSSPRWARERPLCGSHRRDRKSVGVRVASVGHNIEMATMEEKSLGTGAGSDYALPLEGPHGERRRRAHEVLSAQDAYLERLEQTLTEQLQHLAGEVAQSVERAQTVSGDRSESAAIAALQAQFDVLKQQFTALDAECEELRRLNEQAQLDRARSEQELHVRETLVKEAQSYGEQRRVELATLREQLADAQAQLTAARARQQALDQEIAATREQFAAKEEDTKSQRRRIAREFKQQRAERLAEYAERKAELEALAQRRHAELEASLLSCKPTCEVPNSDTPIISQTIENAPDAAADPMLVQELRDECDLLTRKLAAAEAKLNDTPAGGNQDPRTRDDLQRRFEMAVEEVREQKRTIAELENKLKSRGASGGSVSPSGGGGGLNWEAQKERCSHRSKPTVTKTRKPPRNAPVSRARSVSRIKSSPRKTARSTTSSNGSICMGRGLTLRIRRPSPSCLTAMRSSARSARS